ncbi:hypothetical protein KSP40_PGU015741 [Platanthera guangdongensis]|uniref:Uncharacterized protein n=1 Tax=Platanthera guangdongensis TaxID=2320717 RepID=A0ABR2MPQ3_9ASPA
MRTETPERRNMGSSRPHSPGNSSRSRSATPRLCHVAPPLSPNHGARPLPRSSSTAKSRSGSGGDGVRRSSKENRVETVGENCRKVVVGVTVTPSAWALSPGRYPPAEAKGESGGRRRMTGVLGYLRQKKEPSEREVAGHRLKIMAARLMQWRFVNARAEAAMAAKAVAKNKIFFSWLKITEQRNIVAAKRILIQRRKQKIRVIKAINPQLNLLNTWDLLAKIYLVALSSLVKAFEATCLPIPLVEGAKANLVMVHNYICTSMDLMLAIESAIQEFYSKNSYYLIPRSRPTEQLQFATMRNAPSVLFFMKQAELVKSLVCELVEVMRQELEGLVELRTTNHLITSLEPKLATDSSKYSKSLKTNHALFRVHSSRIRGCTDTTPHSGQQISSCKICLLNIFLCVLVIIL